MDDYVKVLKEHGLKVTAPRLEIMRYLDKNRTHPTAAEIFTDLKKKNPSLSRTTVYNTLETLMKNGVIQMLSISMTEMRYDFKKGMHHHFLCKECGCILDIDVKCQFLDTQLNGDHFVEEVHGYFKGICKNCRKKGRKRKRKRS